MTKFFEDKIEVIKSRKVSDIIFVGSNNTKQYFTSGISNLTKMKGKWQQFNKKFIDKVIFTCYIKTNIDRVCQFIRGEPCIRHRSYIIREDCARNAP